MMIPIYHDIVGRGMVMELAFSIDRQGLVEDTHATVYKQLGDWVRACYGSPVASTAGLGTVFSITLRAGMTYDRIKMEENVVLGQRVHSYVVEEQAGAAWREIANGTAIGRKRIQLLAAPVTYKVDTVLRLTVTAAIATPQLKSFGAFAPCATEE